MFGTTSIVGSLVQRTGAATVPVFGLPLPGGRYRYFSIMVNHHNLESATTAIDAVVELLASS